MRVRLTLENGFKISFCWTSQWISKNLRRFDLVWKQQLQIEMKREGELRKSLGIQHYSSKLGVWGATWCPYNANTADHTLLSMIPESVVGGKGI